MNRGLEVKVALVTGGSAGIGEAIVHRLAREGARVAILARREPEGRAVEQAVRAAGGDACFIRCDVTNRALVTSAVATALERYGRLDVLINNAALLRSPHSLAEPDDDAWNAMLHGTLTSAYICTSVAWPFLTVTQRASVVNISSLSAIMALPQSFVARTPRGAGELGTPAYWAAKAGIEALTRYTASAGAPHGVRASCVRPGAILTERIARTTGRHRLADASEPVQLVNGPGYPDDVAGAVAYLASDDARFVTGQVLNVDGGIAVKVQ